MKVQTYQDIILITLSTKGSLNRSELKKVIRKEFEVQGQDFSVINFCTAEHGLLSQGKIVKESCPMLLSEEKLVISEVLR